MLKINNDGDFGPFTVRELDGGLAVGKWWWIFSTPYNLNTNLKLLYNYVKDYNYINNYCERTERAV